MNIYTFNNNHELYGDEYVLKTASMVDRWMSKPYRFVHFTDKPVKGIECRPLIDPEKFSSSWQILGLMTLPEPFLLLALDGVVTGPLDDFAAASELVAIQEWKRPGKINTSCMWVEDCQYIPKQLRMRHLKSREYSWDRYAEQTFIENHKEGELIFWPSEWVPSYKYDCMWRSPEGSKFVTFHGSPKPHEVKGNWVEEYWV